MEAVRGHSRMATEEDADPAGTADGPQRATHSVEISGDTAAVLSARAAALGISIAELIAALAGSAVPHQAADEAAHAPAEPAAARWRDIKAWIDSWGKPDERPRPKLGK